MPEKGIFFAPNAFSSYSWWSVCLLLLKCLLSFKMRVYVLPVFTNRYKTNSKWNLYSLRLLLFSLGISSLEIRNAENRFICIFLILLTLTAGCASPRKYKESNFTKQSQQADSVFNIGYGRKWLQDHGIIQ